MKQSFWLRTGRLLIQGLLLFGLRLAQLRTGFDPNTGLSVPSLAGTVLLAALAACALAEAVLCFRLPKEKTAFSALFAPPEKELPLLTAGSLLMEAAGAVLLGTALPARQIAAMATGALAVAAGIGLMLLIRQIRTGAVLSVYPALPVMLFSVFFVLAVYLPSGSDPVLARYYLPVLAACVNAYAFSLLAGFLRRESSPRAFVCVGNLAVLLNLAGMADALQAWPRLLLHLSCALVLGGFLALRRDTIPADAPEDGHAD